MKISNIDSNAYNAKMALLLSEVDYDNFGEQASAFIKQYHDEETAQLWQTFFKHLNEFRDKKPSKLLLMQLVFRCLELPLTNAHLAQLLTLTQHLKEVYGPESEIFCSLLEAEVPASDRQLLNYLTIFQLLIDLNEMDGLSEQTQKLLPDLQKVLLFLYSKQTDYFNSKYPKRNIDTVLEGFATANAINQFPLKREQLMPLKVDYLAIESHFEKLQSQPEALLRNCFHEEAKQWRESKRADAKHRMIAIMMVNLRRYFKILAYDSQIISFLALLQNESGRQIAQIKAGEGKSTVFAMLVAFKAAEGHFVDLITHSSYLAIRDFKKYQPFLQALGLQSSHIAHLKQEQSHFYGQILYGTNADFEFAWLRDGLNKEKLRYSYRLGESQLSERTFDVIFIDEVDNMMLDTTGSARMAIPGSESNPWIYKPILQYVSNQIKNQAIQKNAASELRAYLQTHIHNKYKPELEKIPNAKLSKWLQSAQIALYQKQEGRDYLVEKDIVIVDYANTGRKNEGCQWQHGIHQLLQDKHNRPVTPESLTAASIAHPPYFNKYNEVYGLTGTMGERAEREEIAEIYAVESFDVPPHLPSQRITHPARVLADTMSHRQAIFQEITNKQKAGRPSLILFETIDESIAFSKYLASKGIAHQLLNETQRESEEYLIGNAGKPKMVTIATNTAGRGTDILPSPESYEAGGLHQIFCFFPENSRVEEQGVCRAARQGKPGSSGMILRADDPGILSLLASSPKSLLMWLNARSDQQKMEILYQLRSEKIQNESKRRRYISKLESLYFNCLNNYFQELKSLRETLNHSVLQTELKDICLSVVKETACIYPINSKSSHWKPILLNAKLLLTEQSLGKQVDWSSFIEQYSQAFVDHVQEYWALFYSRLSDQVEGLDSLVAEKLIQEDYKTLNLAAHCMPEIIKSTLAHVLFKSVSPTIEEIPKKNEGLSAGFFSAKPKAPDLYKKAIQFIKEAKFNEALESCESAHELYSASKGECSIEVGNCFSTMASCYRELKQFDRSLVACEAGITIFFELSKKNLAKVKSLL